MKIDQRLGKAAYEMWLERRFGSRLVVAACAWEELPDSARAAWCSVAQAVLDAQSYYHLEQRIKQDV